MSIADLSDNPLDYDLDDSLRFPPTRAELERENRAQHEIVPASYGEMCTTCGKVNARLREPCTNDIDSCGDTRRLSRNRVLLLR
jgi:hypothetical protein